MKKLVKKSSESLYSVEVYGKCDTACNGGQKCSCGDSSKSYNDTNDGNWSSAYKRNKNR